MKKNILFASALTMSMMLSTVAAPIVADETEVIVKDGNTDGVKVTVEEGKNSEFSSHSYKAYQIFQGQYKEKQVTDEDGKSKVEVYDFEIKGWGSGVNWLGHDVTTETDINWNDTNSLIADLYKNFKVEKNGETVNPFGKIAKADEKNPGELKAVDNLVDVVAGIVDEFSSDGAEAKKFAQFVMKHVNDNGTVLNLPVKGENGDITHNQTNLKAGYYLIVDSVNDNKGEDDSKDPQNLSVLKVVDNKDITIRIKNDIPEIAKKVKENSETINTNNTQDSHTDLFDKYPLSDTTLNDIADYDLNTPIDFEFISKVPDHSEYKTYKYIIHP